MTTPQTSTRMETFTPIFDAVVQDVGLVGASVYGRIWRYCQGGRHCCDAALETIAKALNVSTRTVLRWAKELCEKGYLKDMTPDLRNKPHTYIATNKLHLVVEIRAEVHGMTQSQPGMTESHPDSDRESLEETSNIPEETGGGADAPHAPADDLWPGEVAALREEPPNPAQEQVERMRAKFGDTPGDMILHCQERQKEEGAWTVPSYRDLSSQCAVYRRVYEFSPKKYQRKTIDECVAADEKSLQFWEEICQAWADLGWSPTNIKGMLDRYVLGVLPGTGPEARGKGGSSTPRRNGGGAAQEVEASGFRRVPQRGAVK